MYEERERCSSPGHRSPYDSAPRIICSTLLGFSSPPLEKLTLLGYYLPGKDSYMGSLCGFAELHEITTDWELVFALHPDWPSWLPKPFPPSLRK